MPFNHSKSLQNQSRNRTISFDTILQFGKYRGYRVKELLIKDKQYLQWLVKNVPIYTYSAYLITKLQT